MTPSYQFLALLKPYKLLAYPRENVLVLFVRNHPGSKCISWVMFRPVQVELEEYHEILAQLIQTRELGDLLIKMLYMCRSLKKKKTEEKFNRKNPSR